MYHLRSSPDLAPKLWWADYLGRCFGDTPRIGHRHTDIRSIPQLLATPNPRIRYGLTPTHILQVMQKLYDGAWKTWMQEDGGRGMVEDVSHVCSRIDDHLGLAQTCYSMEVFRSSTLILLIRFSVCAVVARARQHLPRGRRAPSSWSKFGRGILLCEEERKCAPRGSEGCTDIILGDACTGDRSSRRCQGHSV